MAVYAVFEGNMERLEKKLLRIYNKCRKYGCEFSYRKIGEEFHKVKPEGCSEGMYKFILIEAEGTAVMNDWEFVAAVDNTEAGNIFRGKAGIEIPERYYSGKPVCEHCNSSRNRRHTYIVRNTKTGEFKQVGKSCLNDFTHGLSAEAITQYISLFDELIKGEEPCPGSCGERYYERDVWLAYVAETIRHFGYVRSNDEGIWSTAERAMDYYFAREWKSSVHPQALRNLQMEMDRVGFDPDSPETVKTVKDALGWIGQQNENSNYIHNLKTACSLEYVLCRHLGILASLFPAYRKDTEKKARIKAFADAEGVSSYVGQVNDRITVEIKSVSCITSRDTDYGVMRIYKLVGADGNIYMWKTGKFIDEKGNMAFLITGTIKEHKEYRGIKQTELTRCRISKIKEI